VKSPPHRYDAGERSRPVERVEKISSLLTPRDAAEHTVAARHCHCGSALGEHRMPDLRGPTSFPQSRRGAML
jgi:hypothetical protein